LKVSSDEIIAAGEAYEARAAARTVWSR
jgi:uncharacterized protein YegP (UPF0339 family)